MTISISWQHASAGAPAFASLLPPTIKAIERWARVPGKMQEDEFGFYYDVLIGEGVLKSPYVGHKPLRPSTLKLGAMKALQDAPSHWRGWDDEITEIFKNVACGTLTTPTTGMSAVSQFHIPELWNATTLDFMVQLAWFREVMFA